MKIASKEESKKKRALDKENKKLKDEKKLNIAYK